MRTKMSNPVDQPQLMPIPENDPINDPEAGSHLKTLMDAEMIKQDPEKMAKVHALAGRHLNGIKSIQDLKDQYTSKFGGKPKKSSTIVTTSSKFGKTKASDAPAPAPADDGDID